MTASCDVVDATLLGIAARTTQTRVIPFIPHDVDLRACRRSDYPSIELQTDLKSASCQATTGDGKLHSVIRGHTFWTINSHWEEFNVA